MYVFMLVNDNDTVDLKRTENANVIRNIKYS